MMCARPEALAEIVIECNGNGVMFDGGCSTARRHGPWHAVAPHGYREGNLGTEGEVGIGADSSEVSISVHANELCMKSTYRKRQHANVCGCARADCVLRAHR